MCPPVITAGWRISRRPASTSSRWTPTGYGRSARPAPMDDPCNLSEEQQKQFVPSSSRRRATASYPGNLTTIASDWNDIHAVVEHIRKLRRRAEGEHGRVVAWRPSRRRLCGPAPGQGQSTRAACAGLQPRRPRLRPPLPRPGTVFNTQSRSEFDANWDSSCAGRRRNRIAALHLWSLLLSTWRISMIGSPDACWSFCLWPPCCGARRCRPRHRPSGKEARRFRRPFTSRAGLRLGTGRFRHAGAVTRIYALPDGKRLLTIART